VQGFRISKMRGLLALLAPLLLGAGLSCLYLFAHRTALSEVGAKEVQQQGDQEFEDQKAQLDGLEDLKL